MVGLVVSTIVTFWLHSAVLPQASVARQVRVASKVLPQCPVVLVTVLRMVIATLPQASLALGASKVQPLAHSTVLLGTTVMVGGVVSRTVMVCTRLVLLPESSVAVQVRETTLAPPQLLLMLSL